MIGNADVCGQMNDVQAALLILHKLGVDPRQLVEARLHGSESMPTFSQYIPRVTNAVGPGARNAYSPYWQRVLLVWADRTIDDVSALDVSSIAEQAKQGAVLRRNSRGGRSAAEHTIGALRCLYSFAVAEGLISELDNPARRVAKPRRLESTRRALVDSELDEINRIASSTGNDPALDVLLLRLHTETACRRGGALALRLSDLDVVHCVIMLREKGGTFRWQPVSPTLMAHLVEHGDERGCVNPSDALLRYANGRALTSRRYDHLWARLGRSAPWIATQQVSTHWIRHTTLTWVERNFGYAVARAYAGHATGSREPNTTATYVRANITEVATALAALTGECHPLGRPS